MKDRNIGKIMRVFCESNINITVNLRVYEGVYLLKLNRREIVFNTQYSLLSYIEARI